MFYTEQDSHLFLIKYTCDCHHSHPIPAYICISKLRRRCNITETARAEKLPILAECVAFGVPQETGRTAESAHPAPKSRNHRFKLLYVGPAACARKNSYREGNLTCRIGQDKSSRTLFAVRCSQGPGGESRLTATLGLLKEGALSCSFGAIDSARQASEAFRRPAGHSREKILMMLTVYSDYHRIRHHGGGNEGIDACEICVCRF
jgi:hypothetical protein